MILGTFPWRGMQVQADMIANEIVGETIWLNRVDTGTATGLGIIRSGQLFPTRYTPTDELAIIQLRSAFNAFRAEVSEPAA